MISLEISLGIYPLVISHQSLTMRIMDQSIVNTVTENCWLFTLLSALYDIQTEKIESCILYNSFPYKFYSIYINK